MLLFICLEVIGLPLRPLLLHVFMEILIYNTCHPRVIYNICNFIVYFLNLIEIQINYTNRIFKKDTPSVPPISFHFPFWDVPSNSLHFKTYQKQSMGPTISPLFFPFHTTFTPLSSFYILKIDGSHQFTYFLTFLPNLGMSVVRFGSV